jgi:hypothetical protein
MRCERYLVGAIAAQPAVAADRFAHEILGILKCDTMRLRQLNGNPLGRTAPKYPSHTKVIINVHLRAPYNSREP